MMPKKSARIVLGFALLFVTPMVPQEEYYIDVWLFNGTPQETRAFTNPVEILPVDSNLELAPLKSLPAGSENKIKATMLYALSNMHRLLKIEDTFYIRRRLKKGIQINEIAVSKNSIYRIDLSIRSRLGREVAAQAAVIRSKEGVFVAESLGRTELDRAFSISSSKKKMECLIDQEVILNQDDPIILATCSQNEIVYVVFLLRSGTMVEPSPKVRSDDLRVEKAAVAPKAISVTAPLYPRELKRRQLGGELQLVLSIDEKGRVLGVAVKKPVHPYLNYCAVRAFLKWTFEPVRKKGKPVRASFPYSYRFDPFSANDPRVEYEPPTISSNRSSVGDLGDVLAHARDYCRMLSGAALDFVCEETIREHHYNLIDNIDQVILTKKIDPIISIGRSIQLIDPKRTIVNRYICDYQLIRKADVIEERRIILKQNGRDPRIPNLPLKEKRFSGLSSLLSPLGAISGDRQDLFYFMMDKKQRIHGRDTFVIDGIPFTGNEDGIWKARIWIDAQSYGVLRYDVEGIPFEGYDDVLNDCALLNIEPSFKISLEFGFERNGIFFPSSSKIRVTYPAIDMRGPIEKLSIDIRYDKYRFFTVETQSRIIK